MDGASAKSMYTLYTQLPSSRPPGQQTLRIELNFQATTRARLVFCQSTGYQIAQPGAKTTSQGSNRDMQARWLLGGARDRLDAVGFGFAGDGDGCLRLVVRAMENGDVGVRYLITRAGRDARLGVPRASRPVHVPWGIPTTLDGSTTSSTARCNMKDSSVTES